MLDFVKGMEMVMKMCSICSCDDCPLHSDSGGCLANLNPCKYHDLPKVEQILIEWDKEHQEQRYPTWSEWKAENFPETENGELSLCDFARCPIREAYQADCEMCPNKPIPADIAKKLGIKPIERMEG